MLDFDLAGLYEVPTKALKQAVRRNIERFEGEDFMFELTEQEYGRLKEFLSSQFVTLNDDDSLRSQFATLKNGRGQHTKYLPYAFTEQGVAMLSGLLKSDVAIEVNISIMRAFVALRQMVMTSVEIRQLALENAEIRAKLALLERNDEDTLEAVNDLSEDLRRDISDLYNAIGELSIKTPPPPRKPIGYRKNEE